MRTFVTAGFLIVQVCAFGETAPLAFEVASVKPLPPPDPHHISVRMSTDAGRLRYTNVTLRDVLKVAYRVKERQIEGPDWINTERYEISAKLPEGATEKQIPEMLQSLLAERFKVTLHRETKVMPVYALVEAKGGPKLKETDPEKHGMNVNTGPKGRKMSGNVTLAGFVDMLSNMMDRPVLDMTKLTGTYSIELEWSPEENREARPGAAGGEAKPVSDAPDGPTIFTALQEKLGLKLEARKLPVEMLTIDHAERVPTEN